jgi:hypothetical protein
MTDQDMQAAYLQRTQCLRDRGYEVDDPKPGTALAVPEDVTKHDLDACFQR